MHVLLGYMIWSVIQAVVADNCPYGCKRCKDPHGTVNGTIKVVAAYCTKNPSITDIPSDLPGNLGLLNVRENAIHLLRNTSLELYLLLKTLDLRGNALRNIEAGSFKNQKFLQMLILQQNSLVSLNAEMFEGLDSLQELYLQDNSISRLPQGVFKALKSLRMLFLYDNHIGNIPNGVFEGLDYLSELHLSSNGIKKLDYTSFGSLMSLKMIDISFNEIGSIGSNTFTCTPLLEILHINNNILKSVPIDVLRKVRLLKELDLSENPITYIGSNSFALNTNLELLQLNNCKIDLIQDGAFSNLQALRKLELYNNSLNCDCRLMWLHTWLLEGQGNVVQLLQLIRCSQPANLSGKVISRVNALDFRCSCETCRRVAGCINGTSCNCESNWEGISCDVICKTGGNTSGLCFNADGQCHCANGAKPQKGNEPQCNFEITNKTCGVHAELTKIGRRLECDCKKGFHGDGVNCSDIDECLSESKFCHSNTECVNNLGSYRCQCRRGYKDRDEKFPGLMCIDINECKSTPCKAHAKCFNSGGSYTCVCNKGYQKVNQHCYPRLLPDNIVVTAVKPLNSTALLVTWSVSDSKAVIASYRIKYLAFGQPTSDYHQAPETYASNASEGVLGHLTPETIYLVKVSATTIQNITVESKVVHSTTSGNVHTTKDPLTSGDNTNIVLIVGSLVGGIVVSAVALVLVICCVKRRRKARDEQPRNYLPSMEDLIELRLLNNGISQAGAEVSVPKEIQGRQGPALLSFPTLPDRVDVWEVSRDKVTLGDKIGEGQFGIVFGGTLLTNEGPVKAAVKCIKDWADSSDMNDLRLEMEMMKEIGYHPNVVSLLGTCTTARPMYIITEYVSGGNLLDLLRHSRHSNERYVNVVSTLTSRDLLRIALDVARGMSHIALKKFVHRDLATRNVLMTDTMTAKVADFGLARDIYCEGKYVKTGGGRLPIKWMAPEAIRDQIYTTKSDVWSFGILLWEIVTLGESPYPTVPLAMLLEKMLYGYTMPQPDHCSDEVYGIMEDCWDLDPCARPSFDELSEILSCMLSETCRTYVNMQFYSESPGGSRVDLDDINASC